LLNRYAKLSVLITTFICIVLFFLPDSVYQLFFGSYYVGINRSLKWFIPGVIAYNFYLVFQSFYLGMGLYRKLIIINVISFVSLILAAFFWIPTRFFSGAAAAASVSFTISSFLLTFDYLKSTHQSFQILLPEKGDWLFINSLLKSIFKRV
jgi:O-antigen/teichoic acid export membrane protein